MMDEPGQTPRAPDPHGRTSRYAMGPARWLIATAVVAFLVGLLWWGAAVNEDTPVAERPAATGAPSDGTVGTAPRNGPTGDNTSR